MGGFVLSLLSMGFCRKYHHLLCSPLVVVMLNIQLLLIRQGMNDMITSHVAKEINVCERGVELNLNKQMEL